MSADAPNEIGELLSAYLDDEVSTDERARVEQLLASDPDARALFEELRATAHAVRALPKGAAPPDVLSAITTRLERETLLGAADPDVTLARHRRPPVRSTLAVAAMLAVAIGGGLYVMLQLSEAPPGESQLARKDVNRAHELRQNEVSGGGTPGGRTRALNDAEYDRGVIQSLSSGSKAVAPAGEGRAGGSVDGDRIDSTPANDVFGRSTQDTLTELGMTPIEHPAEIDSLARTATPEEKPAVDSALRALGYADKSAVRMKAEELAARTEAAPRLIGDSLVAGGDGPTFEQRLAGGDAWPALKSHVFANEPLRLAIRFRAEAGAESFQGRIEQMLADRQVPPASAIAGDAEGDDDGRASRPSLVQRAAEAAVPSTRRLMFVVGEPGVNYAPDTPVEREMLARIPPGWLEDLIEETIATDAERISLQLGGLNAEGPEAARQLVRELVTPPRSAPAVTPQQTPNQPSGWLALLQRLAPGRGMGKDKAAVPSPATVRARRDVGAIKEMQTQDPLNDNEVSSLAFADADGAERAGTTLVDAAPTNGMAGSTLGNLPIAAESTPTAGELITVVIELDVDEAPSAVDTNG